MPKARFDAPFINRLLTSVETTLTQILQCDVSRGQVYFWKNRLAEREVAVLTGVVGQSHTGIILYSLKWETAQRMLEYLDPMTTAGAEPQALYEGLGEIVSILSGNTIASFSRDNVVVDITTPSVITGGDVEVHLLNQATLSADMMSRFGTLKVNIAVKQF
jgi:chemotaxis protein CheX